MSKIDIFPYPIPITAKIWGVPFGVDPSCWGLQRVKRLGLSAVKVFSKNSNLYYYNTSTLQIDGQTDGQTTCLGNTALHVVSCGKNVDCTMGYTLQNVFASAVKLHLTSYCLLALYGRVARHNDNNNTQTTIAFNIYNNSLQNIPHSSMPFL